MTLDAAAMSAARKRAQDREINDAVGACFLQIMRERRPDLRWVLLPPRPDNPRSEDRKVKP